MASRRLFCTFLLDDMFLGIEVEKVQEIIRQPQFTRVPLASPVIHGLINLRGHIVTAIALRRRLGLAEDSVEERSMNLVLQTSAGLVSVLVDQVGDVVAVDDADFERPPDSCSGPARELIRGAYKLKEHLLLVLEADEVVKIAA